MLEDAPVSRERENAPIRQSENLTEGGTFSVGEVPTGIARPNAYNTIDQFTDGYGEGDVGTKGTFGGDAGDFFSGLGTARARKETQAEKLKKKATDLPKMSPREINTSIYSNDGSRLDSSVQAIAGQPSSNSNTADGTRPPLPGSSGSNWRMMKLKRAYEAAEYENRSFDEVGPERFGSIELFEAAKEERAYLDNQSNGRRGTPNVGLMRGRDPNGSRRPGPSRSDTPGSTTSTAGEEPELDEFGRERRKASTDADSRPGTPQPQSSSATRYIFNEPGSGPSSRPPSRQGSFRRPGSAVEEAANQSSRSGTPVQASARGGSKPSTPIPSVFTPPPPGALRRGPSQLVMSTTASDAVNASQSDPSLISQAPMSPTSLNKLQAKILRLRLMGGSSASELQDLETKYEQESQRARQGDNGAGYFDSKDVGGSAGGETEVRVLPTLDGRGRLYDIGRTEASDATAAEEEKQAGPGNKRKRKEAKFETRDAATGELLRYNADDDTTTLEELVRQERFGGGSSEQKNMDAELASRITTDAKFEDDLDYMDDSADRLARKKMKTETQKKLFAINDYNRTKKALESCQFCYQDTETSTIPPQAAVVAMGTRAYLSLPLTEPLVPGHAIIVPMQHHLASLEADDDTWDEMKVCPKSYQGVDGKLIMLLQNFMKTLMQMHAERDHGVLFYETVLSFKGQRHTYIEAVPLPWNQFEEMPAYFREALLTSEAEWSQHKKLIDFSKRPGGFRRSLVATLPYFMIHWDYRGEKGFGHVIEGAESAEGAGDGYDFDEGAKGGGQFERYFAAEIIGNVLDLEPRLWRKPRRMDRRQNEERVAVFRKGYDQFDWTKLLAQTSDARQ